MRASGMQRTAAARGKPKNADEMLEPSMRIVWLGGRHMGFGCATESMDIGNQIEVIMTAWCTATFCVMTRRSAFAHGAPPIPCVQESCRGVLFIRVFGDVILRKEAVEALEALRASARDVRHVAVFRRTSDRFGRSGRVAWICLWGVVEACVGRRRAHVAPYYFRCRVRRASDPFTCGAARHAL